MRAACMVFLLLTAACKCLPEPAGDISPPTAGLRIEYREPGGGRVLKEFFPGDSDTTIVASKNDTVAVVYSGGDPEGLRRIDLEYDVWRQIGCCTTQQGLVVALYQQSSCPRGSLLQAENFEPNGTDWSYKFATRAENWVGTMVQTPTVTVRTQ